MNTAPGFVETDITIEDSLLPYLIEIGEFLNPCDEFQDDNALISYAIHTMTVFVYLNPDIKPRLNRLSQFLCDNVFNRSEN